MSPKPLSLDDLHLFDSLARHPPAPRLEKSQSPNADILKLFAASSQNSTANAGVQPPFDQGAPSLHSAQATADTVAPMLGSLRIAPALGPAAAQQPAATSTAAPVAPKTPASPTLQDPDDSFGDFGEFQDFSAQPSAPVLTADLWTTPSAPAPTPNNPALNTAAPPPSTDDDFGDFVSTPISPQPRSLLSLAPAPATASHTPTPPAPSKRPQVYAIQAQINDLSAHDPAVPIRFGMHSEVDTAGPAKAPKWEDILSARQGTAATAPRSTENLAPGHARKQSVTESAPRETARARSGSAARGSASSMAKHPRRLVKSHVKPDATAKGDLLLIDTSVQPHHGPQAVSSPAPFLVDLLQPMGGKQEEEKSVADDDDNDWSGFQEVEPSACVPPHKRPGHGPSPAALSILSSSKHRKTPSTSAIPTPSSTALPADYAGIPASTELLELVHTKVLRVVEPLFAALVPLSYALKKRVLAAPKTRDFLQGYWHTLVIVRRIMAGRYRRLAVDVTAAAAGEEERQEAVLRAQMDADRQAREVERVWTLEIAPRLRAARNILPAATGTTKPGSSSKSGSKSAALLDPDMFELSASAVVAKPAEVLGGSHSGDNASAYRQCVVCGLYPSERVPGTAGGGGSKTRKAARAVAREVERADGDHSEEWSTGAGAARGLGHVTCLQFWAHRANYGL